MACGLTMQLGSVPEAWVTQMLRQTDAKVFKKYLEMKLQMKREAVTQIRVKPTNLPARRVFIEEEANELVLIQF
jgi:hypothetical protein